MDKSAELRTSNASPDLGQTQHVDHSAFKPTVALVIIQFQCIHNPSPRPISLMARVSNVERDGRGKGAKGLRMVVSVCKVSGVKGGRFEVFEV